MCLDSKESEQSDKSGNCLLSFEIDYEPADSER